MASLPIPRPASSGATCRGSPPGTESSVSFSPLQDLHGIITPNGLFFERHHAGRPDVDPDQHRLMIHGLVERPLVLSMKDIMRFPSVSRIHFIECPANGGMEWRAAQLNSLQFNHGMISCAEWTGVRLSTLLEEVGIKKEAQWAMVEGADGAHMNRSLPLDKCLDDCLVVYAQNGEALRPEQGYPLRLRGARLGRQCQHQMAAPDQARRQALVFARRNLEIHRPDAGRHLARVSPG